MQTDAMLGMSLRGEELRYVTAHFRDLQGLRTAPLWAELLILAGMASSDVLSRQHLVATALAIILLNFAWLFWSRRFYERRFGVVTAPERPVPSGLISIMHPEVPPSPGVRDYGNRSGHQAVIFFLYALYLVPEIFRRFDHRSGQFGLLAVAFFLLPRCFFPAPANGLIRLRRTLSFAGSMIILAVYLSYLFAQVGKWPYLAALFATLLLLDIYDHWLLTRLLRSGSAEASYE